MILSYFTTHSRITDNDSICDYTMNIATTMTSLRLLSLSLLVRRLHGEMEVERDVHYGTTMVWSPPEPLPERSLADAAIDESQLNALQDLYDATNASASLNFNDWLRPPTDPLHTHYCDFTGVSCDDELYVIGLDLNQTGLSGTIPDSIRNLERLRRFKVWMNDHLGEIPTAFGDLKHLEYLILGQNNFVGTIPDLSGATSLKRLLFQSNDLTGTVPTSLCNLSHLRELDLSRNGGLSGTLPACLGDLPDLRYVKVRDAEFSGGIPLELCARSEYGCDGIACGAGTYQFPHGRQTSDSRPCLVCPTSSGLIGCTRCDGGIGETYMPSSSPSATPSTAPSLLPSVSPRSPPSAEPSAAPSILPSVAFSVSPSAAPSILPSVFPSFAPSDVPTVFPSAVPSTAPTSSSRPPTDIPSNSPSQVLEMTKRPTSNVNPSPAPSLVTPSPTLIPSFVPTVLAAGVFSSFPSNSPTSKPALSPSTDFVIGGLNQGTYEDNTPKRWTWGIVAVILILASCCLVGLVGVGRRRRRHGSELSESIDCLPDDDSGVSPSTPSSVPVDPLSFLEMKSQRSLHDAEEGIARHPYDTCVEYVGAAGEHTASKNDEGPSLDLETEYEMNITSSGIEFVSVASLPKECRDDISLRQEKSRALPPQSRPSPFGEVREMPPSPISVKSARHERKRVTFQLSLEDQYSSDDKWLICEHESSSTGTADSYKKHPDDRRPLPPPSGDQVVEQPPVGFRRRWLPVENFYPYE